MLQASTAIKSCNHNYVDHLFNHPLCEARSLLYKVATVALHIFSLAVPLAIYHFVSWAQRKWTSRVEAQPDTRTDFQRAQDELARYNSDHPEVVVAPQETKPVATLGKVSIQPYTVRGQAALDFARAELAKYPDLEPKIFAEGYFASAEHTHQPMNREIALLATLKVKQWELLTTAFQENLTDPWKSRAVIEAANACMMTSYAISSLTLDDLPAFSAMLKDAQPDPKSSLAWLGEEVSYAEILTRQVSYQYRTFYSCTFDYHWFRGGITWGKKPSSKKDEESLDYNEPSKNPQLAPEEHAALFYEEGTSYNEWRLLYNDYCERVRMYVTEAELNKGDTRHVGWTRQDKGLDTFYRWPAERPS